MGSIGAGSGNTFRSDFGFKNVGTRELFQGIGGATTVGTATPEVNDVQEYLDSGRFDNYGNNARAKNQMVKAIARDMNGRGFEMQVSEDGTKLLPNGETGLAIAITRRNDRWMAKGSSSAGTRERGGMRGTLDRISRRR